MLVCLSSNNWVHKVGSGCFRLKYESVITTHIKKSWLHWSELKTPFSCEKQLTLWIWISTTPIRHTTYNLWSAPIWSLGCLLSMATHWTWYCTKRDTKWLTIFELLPQCVFPTSTELLATWFSLWSRGKCCNFKLHGMASRPNKFNSIQFQFIIYRKLNKIILYNCKAKARGLNGLWSADFVIGQKTWGKYYIKLNWAHT